MKEGVVGYAIIGCHSGDEGGGSGDEGGCSGGWRRLTEYFLYFFEEV